MIISTDTYNEILSKVQKHKGNYRELEAELATQYELPKNTVSSIISNENKRKMKKSHYKINNMTGKLYERYQNLKGTCEDSTVMIKLGDELDVPYSVVAKTILEKWCEEHEESSSGGNKSANVKQYLKDSTLIEDHDLAYEIFLCQLYDYQYGHINDIIRHSFGQEYEYHLQKIVRERNLTFQSEDDLRVYGYDKTPDIKLDVPFAVDGFVVNWIESKALFGDIEEHKNYVKDQYSSYWNRFGTGMVIYWLGMVDAVNDPQEKRFIVRDNFPQEITLTDPFIIAKIPKSVDLKPSGSDDSSSGNSSGNEGPGPVTPAASNKKGKGEKEEEKKGDEGAQK